MGDFFVYSAFALAIFLLFPVFVEIYFYADAGQAKVWFSVSLYRILPAIGGYAEPRQEGIAVHLTEKFALLVPYADMSKARKKFEIFKGFQLLRLHQTLECGGAEAPYSALVGAAFSAVSGSACSVLLTRHPFLSLRSRLILSDRPAVRVTAEAALVFNQLVLLVAISKKILEALINWIRKHKSTASWRRRQSASSAS